MRTSTRKSPKKSNGNPGRVQRAFVPTSALAKTLKFNKDSMQVHFADGRILSVPLVWFPILHKARPEQRLQFEIGGGGTSLHWPELDEDLSIAGLMAGVDRQSA